MNISIKATNLDLTPSIKDYVNEKIGHLGKYIDAIEAKVELERDRHHHTGAVFRTEVSLIIGGKVMMADASAEDIYSSTDMVVPKIKEQISKFKDKKNDLQKRGARAVKRRR